MTIITNVKGKTGYGEDKRIEIELFDPLANSQNHANLTLSEGARAMESEKASESSMQSISNKITTK